MVSLVAPVVTDAVVVPGAVGVPETEQEIDAPTATVAGGVGVQVPTVTPGGSPEIEHVAFEALAVAVAEFVHRMVPEYGTPTSAVAGRPERFGCMSEPEIVSVPVSELFPVLKSFEAIVRPLSGNDPVAVGVPETVQTIEAPGATVAGVVGEQVDVRPAGKPETLQRTFVAAIDGALAFVQVKVPE